MRPIALAASAARIIYISRKNRSSSRSTSFPGSSRSVVLIPSFPESIAESGFISFLESILERFSGISVPSAGTSPAPVIPAAAIIAATSAAAPSIPSPVIAASSAAITATVITSAAVVTTVPTASAATAVPATTVVTTTVISASIPVTHDQNSFFLACTVSYEQRETRVTTSGSDCDMILMHRFFLWHIR